jgi:CDP-diglyceride synthetase
MNNDVISRKKEARKVRLKIYFSRLGSALSEAPFSAGTWIYSAIVFVGIAAASWFIPFINSADTSAETLGIYVIGILIAVFADSLFLWKNSTHDDIAETIIVTSFLLCLLVGYFSVKVPFINSEGETVKRFRSYSEFFIFLILIISILMWAMINAVDPRLNIAATNNSAEYSQLSGK